MTLKKFLRAGSALGMGLIMMTSLVPAAAFADDNDRRTPQVRGSNMSRDKARTESPRPQPRAAPVTQPAAQPAARPARAAPARTERTRRGDANTQTTQANRGPRQGSAVRNDTPRTDSPRTDSPRTGSVRQNADRGPRGGGGGNWQGRNESGDRNGQRAERPNTQGNSYNNVRGAGSRGETANRDRDRDRDWDRNRDRDRNYDRGRDRDRNWSSNRGRDRQYHGGRHYVERHNWRPHGRQFRLNYRQYDTFYGYSGLRVGFYFAPGYGYYNVPTQYYNARYRIGDYLPSFFHSYRINDPGYYDLPYMPFGTEYYFVGRDVVLVDMATGVIIDIFYDVY